MDPNSKPSPCLLFFNRYFAEKHHLSLVCWFPSRVHEEVQQSVMAKSRILHPSPLQEKWRCKSNQGESSWNGSRTLLISNSRTRWIKGSKSHKSHLFPMGVWSLLCEQKSITSSWKAQISHQLPTIEPFLSRWQISTSAEKVLVSIPF